MIKVTCEVPNCDEPAKHSIRVHSHWNNNNLIVLEVGDEKVTVKGDDLQAAIKNCTNTKRFT